MLSPKTLVTCRIVMVAISVHPSDGEFALRQPVQQQVQQHDDQEYPEGHRAAHGLAGEGPGFIQLEADGLGGINEEEQNIIKEAILDHRASGEGEPRSIYGKLVSSADRVTDVFMPLKRTYEYRLATTPDMPLEEMILEAKKHIVEKFGEFGYASEKMYFADPEYDKFLRDIRMLVEDESLFREMFIRVNSIKGTDIDNDTESDK